MVKRTKALVLIRREVVDRPFVEVYGDNTLDVRLVNLPFTGTDRGAILAEDVLSLQLPHCYRDIFNPGNIRGHELVTLQRPSEVVDRWHHGQLLRALDNIGQPRRDRRA